MNFPSNQKTGALAEIDVERLFTSWNWNVGHDRIDVGYDLCVMPDRAQYKGARFLVQVKGTAQKKKGAIVAPVSKERLRQYAEDLLPVFIVRVTSDGSIYWLHAQSWTSSNNDRLNGSGESGVRFNPNQKLIDRQCFEAYLAEVLLPINGRATTFFDLGEESRFLNSLDPRLGVRLSVQDKGKTREIYARSEDVEGKLEFVPLKSSENLGNLREIIDFGLPRPVEVENFKMTGSPLFDELNASGPNKGTIIISPAETNSGVVRLFPGETYSITAQELALDAEFFRGTKGAAITNESKKSVYDLSIRMVRGQLSGQATISIGFRFSSIAGRPIQNIDALRPLAAWADQVATQGAIFAELAFMGVRAPLVAPRDAISDLHPFLRFARTLSRLHLVAKALDLNVTLDEDLKFSAEDIKDIDLVYALLKGERCRVDLGPIEFEPSQPPERALGAEFYCTTNLSFEILGQPFGEIPVAIELSGFIIEKVLGSANVRLSKGDVGQAWISYAEHSDVEHRLVRKSS